MKHKQITIAAAFALLVLVSSITVAALAAPTSPGRSGSQTLDPLQKTASERDQNPTRQKSLLNESKTGHNVTISRQKQTVTISVDESVFEERKEPDKSNVNDPPSSQTVQIQVRRVEGSVELELVKQQNGPYTKTISIKDLVNESGWERDLSSATVEVVSESEGETLGNDTIDLRWITLTGERQIQGQKLIVPVQTIIGIPDGTKLGFQFEDSSIQGTVNHQGNSPNVSLDLKEAPRTALLSSSITLTPEPKNITDSPITIDISSLVADATEFRYSNKSLTLENPVFTLLPSNERYAVRVYEPEGKVIFATVNDTQNGKLSLPQAFVYRDIEVAIWTDDGNHQVLSRGAPGKPYSVSKPTVNATLTGRNLTVHEGNWLITTLLYRNETGDVHGLDVTRSNGTYRVENASVLSTKGSVILIADSRQILDANLTSLGSGQGDITEFDDRSGGGLIGLFYSGLRYIVAPLAIVVGVSITLGGLLYLFRFYFSDPRTRASDVIVAIGLVGAAVSIVVNEYNPFWHSFSLARFGFIGIWMVAVRNGVVAVTGFLFALLSSDQIALRFGGNEASTDGTETIPRKQIKVVVQDKEGNPITSEVQITAKPYDPMDVPLRGETHQMTAQGGRASLKLPHNNFRIIARIGDHENSQMVNVGGVSAGKTIRIALKRPRIRVKGIDKESRKAISNATVTVKTERETNEKTVGSKGETIFKIPFTAKEVEIEAEADRYESERKLKPVSGSVTKIPVELEPKTGDLRVMVTIDGQATAGIPIAVVPGGDLRRNDRQVTGESNSRGEFTARGLLVGEYQVGFRVDNEWITDRTTRVRVKEDDTKTVTLDGQFDWTLSTSQRHRIDDLRAKIDSLSDRRNRDVAIPRYFGSVVEEVLNAVESLEDAGHLFVKADLEPDELAEGTLDAAEAMVERVDQAMTTKTNVDLFVACADMTDPEIHWDGEVPVNALFERTTRQTSDLRNELAERMDSVNDRLEQERPDLAEIAPVQTILEETRELLRQSREMDPITQKVTMYVIEVMIDAIEQIFEHTPLKERMKNTVF